MARDITQTVYKLEELEPRARERALSTLSDWATSDSFWYESVIDQCKETGAMLGIEISDIYFSGFSSQGDGACFTGTYGYRKGALKAIKKEWPEETKLHSIAEKLQRIESRNFYRLTANVKQVGRYFSMEVDTDTANVEGDDGNDGELADTLRDFAHWIYRQLEAEYNYRTSEEALIEDAAVNQREWFADGTLA